MITSMKSLIAESRVFGFITRTFLLISLALIICTCSGLRLTSGNQISVKQTDYSFYSGRLVKPMYGLTGCATLRTGVLGSHLWHPERSLIWQPYPLTLDMVYYPSLGLTLRPCSPIRWYPYPLITPSFSNRYRTVWTGQRPSSPTVSQPVNLPDVNLPPTKPYRNYRDWTPQSTGRTREITPTMGRNSNSSSMMNRGSGKNPTTSSTTGGSRRQH